MSAKPTNKKHPTVSMGVELETYSVSLPDYRICRELHFPKRSIVEKGERFTRDLSIGPEYNSKVFTTIREAFFLLKSSLRKYSQFLPDGANSRHAIFPVGGWIDRFAGAHLHLALGKAKFSYDQAKNLAASLHDHIPFLIVLAGNSPVWREKMTHISSNRLLRGSDRYCRVTKRGTLYTHHFRELTFNQGGKRKPPTLEVRVCDSSVPEYVAAALCVCKAVALHWLKRKRPYNRLTHANYLKAREQAVRLGSRARLSWANHWFRVPEYVDLFFRKYEEELRQMDIPDEVMRVFKYLKKGWNQADLIRTASERCFKKNRQTWQKQFAKKYAGAIAELLDGNSYERFAQRLGVKMSNIQRVWLGRREAKW